MSYRQLDIRTVEECEAAIATDEMILMVLTVLDMKKSFEIGKVQAEWMAMNKPSYTPRLNGDSRLRSVYLFRRKR